MNNSGLPEKPAGATNLFQPRQDYTQRIVDLSGKISEDEPVFLLRGQDYLAANVLSFYAWCLEMYAFTLRILPGADMAARVDQLTAMVLAVRIHAQKMETWRVRKYPDANIDSLILTQDEAPATAANLANVHGFAFAVENHDAILAPANLQPESEENK